MAVVKCGWFVYGYSLHLFTHLQTHQQAEAKSSDFVSKKALGLENKIIQMQQKLDDKVHGEEGGGEREKGEGGKGGGKMEREKGEGGGRRGS